MSATTAEPARDTSAVDAADWPFRRLIKPQGSRTAGFQVVYKQSVLDQIHLHGQSKTDVEVCGVIVGRGYVDDSGPYLLVEHAIRGTDAASRSTNVTFTAATWQSIQTVMDRDHTDKKMVGWYHTHPGFGIFLSDMDVFICDNFFNLPWQQAFVYDPLGGDEGNFLWRSGKPTREPVLIEDDVTPVAGSVPLIGVDEAMTGAPPEESFVGVDPRVTELLVRVRRLEKRLKWLAIASAFLAAFVVMWVISITPELNGRGNRATTSPTSSPAANKPNSATPPTPLQSTPAPAMIRLQSGRDIRIEGAINMAEPAGDDKIKIEWDDLNTRKVDQRLKEQEALARNRQQADRVPVASIDLDRSGGFFSNAVVVMALFGLLGGLLAWGARQAFQLRTDLKAEADLHRKELAIFDDKDRAREDSLKKQKAIYTSDPEQTEKFKKTLEDLQSQSELARKDTQAARDELVNEYGDNPYFKAYADPALTPDQKSAAVAQLDQQQAPKNMIARMASFGLAGLLISVCLSVADPLTAGNKPAAVLNGLLGAVLGVVGGIAASFLFDKIFQLLAPGATNGLDGRQVLARSASWGVLGLFLAIGPGLAVRNLKKFAIGVIGGIIGGLVGGAIFEPVFVFSGGIEWISWGIALSLIGLTAGLATGLIENAAKSGWVKVTAGLIAGKQFILYRNPTFIGSGPECPIYLFRDPKVGKRHAAIHLLPGGFELENLPLGDVTTVNEKPVSRTRLKTGDVIGVGATRFEFHEKKREKKAG